MIPDPGPSKAVRIVAATRWTREQFKGASMLAAGLARVSRDERVAHTVIYENDGPGALGLPAVFNRFLDEDHSGEIFLFVHDDVYFDDYHLVARLNDAMKVFDVVGVAGNRDPEEPWISWALYPEKETGKLVWQDRSRLSGAVSHLVDGNIQMSFYGPTPAPCKLLDGCFLAVNADVVVRRGVRFDERFSFHFYDLDFCRSCDAAGLRMGTWPIAITHASGGIFEDENWRRARDRYLSKWAK